MTRVRFTAGAREDLLHNWLYVATRNSEAVADRVHDNIERTCGCSTTILVLAEPAPEIQPEARSIVIERWLVPYGITEDGAQVVRIIDRAGDLSAIEWTHE